MIRRNLLSLAIIVVFLTAGSVLNFADRACAKDGRSPLVSSESRIATANDARFLKEKSAVLIFFSPTCPICCEYFPELQKLNKTYSSDDREFWLVMESDKESVEKFVKEYNPSEQILLDAHGVLQAEFKARVTPEIVVLNRGTEVYRGRIDDRYYGIGQRRHHASSRDLEEVLLKLTQGKTLNPIKTDAIGCFLEPHSGSPTKSGDK